MCTQANDFHKASNLHCRLDENIWPNWATPGLIQAIKQLLRRELNETTILSFLSNWINICLVSLSLVMWRECVRKSDNVVYLFTPLYQDVCQAALPVMLCKKLKTIHVNFDRGISQALLTVILHRLHPKSVVWMFFFVFFLLDSLHSLNKYI